MINMPDHIAPILSDYEALMAEVREIVGNDINASEALMIAFIGDKRVFPSDLIPLGYYQGKNPTYALKNLQIGAYVKVDDDERDGRRKIVYLTGKGLEVAEKLRSELARQKRKVAA